MGRIGRYRATRGQDAQGRHCLRAVDGLDGERANSATSRRGLPAHARGPAPQVHLVGIQFSNSLIFITPSRVCILASKSMGAGRRLDRASLRASHSSRPPQ